ncbi:MAG: hypothetical protein A3G18_10365 [Rhodospirillales bacterium RIFCSPLOWO2_12_FULL_58_28]|nr:MAG: hypothetical protein A3H92_08540 [Rhodospirillales bacterium RIFCSPLOWO2_02_FULL_58_16]OHC77709.1 MAG: hypothetical protein A3G18_10365 [Rhodospirillales bacterium RIFCSPLOWO2_12_FULL_58_28]
MFGEARGEHVRGKEAVASVIINRVRRAKDRNGYWWGDSVAAVCRRPWQFSCWNENDPNRDKIETIDQGNEVFACCVRIARRAVAGVLKDPTGGATHYHAKSVTPPWAGGLMPCVVIGNHKFYNNVE